MKWVFVNGLPEIKDGQYQERGPGRTGIEVEEEMILVIIVFVSRRLLPIPPLLTVDRALVF